MLIKIDRQYNNPLVTAYLDGDYESFKNLIDTGANINCMSNTGESLICMVVRHLSSINRDLNKKFFDLLINNDVHLGRICSSNSPLELSFKNNETNYYMEKILKKITEINYFERYEEGEFDNSNPNPNLFKLLSVGYLKKIKLYLDYNPDLKVKNIDGVPVLNYLILNDNNGQVYRYAINLFLEKGADPNQTDNQHRSFLHYMAIKFHDKKLFDLSIEKGACVNAVDESGATPLMYASSADHCDFMKLAIENGSIINQQDHFGKTAVIYAAHQFRYYALKCLDNCDCDFSIQDNNGDNFAHHILSNISFNKINDFMEFFVKYSDQMKVKNNTGESPLDIMKFKNPKIYSKFCKMCDQKESTKNLENLN